MAEHFSEINIEELLKRVTPMLGDIDLKTVVPVAIDMDDRHGKNKAALPELIQKYGVLHEQHKINTSEYRRLLKHESKNGVLKNSDPT